MNNELEQVYNINIEDAEKLYNIAKENNDLDLMQKATVEKQKWIDKLQALHNIK